MVTAGMTPLQVIVASTRNCAEFLRMTDAGTLASRQERRLHRARRQSARRHHQHAAHLVGVSARRCRGPRATGAVRASGRICRTADAARPMTTSRGTPCLSMRCLGTVANSCCPPSWPARHYSLQLDKPRSAETLPGWSTSAAVARCTWSAAARAPRPSCWWRASRVQPRIGALPRHPEPTVFAEVAKFTRVCAYDRPGTPVGEKPSRSDPVRQPTTAGDAVADLHALC